MIERDHRRDPRRLLRGDRHHPGGDGEHDGDDARASGCREYATLKALGFRPGFVALLIFGESRCADLRAWRRPWRSRRHVPQAADGVFKMHWCRDVLPGASRSRPSTLALQAGVCAARCGSCGGGIVPALARGARPHRSKACARSADGSADEDSFAYVARNLWTRRLTTALTAGGMALVVFVFAAVLMLDAGLEQHARVDRASRQRRRDPRRARRPRCRAASSATRRSLIETSPEVARGADGQAAGVEGDRGPDLAAEAGRAEQAQRTWSMRGTARDGLALRPQVRIVEGRHVPPGLGRDHRRRVACARQFAGVEIGQQLSLRAARVDGGRRLRRRQAAAFDSEIWGDVEQMMQAFRRTAYSSVIAQAGERRGVRTLQAEARRRSAAEGRYRSASGSSTSDQSRALSNFITLLGITLSMIFSHRRDDRGDDHDVRGGRQPHRRDRHAARARVPARGRSSSLSCPSRCCSALLGGLVGPGGARRFMQPRSPSRP